MVFKPLLFNLFPNLSFQTFAKPKNVYWSPVYPSCMKLATVRSSSPEEEEEEEEEEKIKTHKVMKNIV